MGRLERRRMSRREKKKLMHRRIFMIFLLCGILFLLNFTSVSEDILQLQSKADSEHDGIQPVEAASVTGHSAEFYLTLVNSEHLLDSSYRVEVTTMNNGYQFEAHAAEHLQAMLLDAERNGLAPVVCSAYRSHQKQIELFRNKVSRVKAEGYTDEEAEEIAKAEVAYPGTSEHELGLAVDIVSKNYTELDDGYENTNEAKWLKENCAKYGFILRYPKDKTEVTQYIYEPWHFRYVGVEAAEAIMDGGLCLEEYLEQ